jgi:hypothetical protein
MHVFPLSTAQCMSFRSYGAAHVFPLPPTAQCMSFRFGTAAAEGGIAVRVFSLRKQD